MIVTCKNMSRMIAPQLKNLEGLFSTEVTSVSYEVSMSSKSRFLTSRKILSLIMVLNVLQEGGSNLEAYANATFDPSLSWKVFLCKTVFFT